MSAKIEGEEVTAAIDELAEQHEEQFLEDLDDSLMMCGGTWSTCNVSCTEPITSG